ncbi:hypothetical protein HMPREF0044_0865 [Gleimia coleocanis DSM 15436]|uniref:ATP synthase F0, A subunit n=2 Tax=Gleimia TaxID=2692113 RepID=C0VZY7_9ACTO|nr:hypothetical protein HMPREF0044_0865 [Gleimia coleocanis DSM 15436]
MTLQNLTFAVLLAIAIGWLLVIGQNIILPIIAAFIVVYIFVETDKLVGKLPGISKLPDWVRKFVIYVVFIGLLAGLISLFTVTIQELIAHSGTYQKNLVQIFSQVTDLVGEEHLPSWDELRAKIIGAINIPAWLGWVTAQLSSASGFIFLIAIYVAFIFGERSSFSQKLTAAFPDPVKAARAQQIISEINTKVGQYLGAKTLVNVILGLVSYVIMLAFGLDYAGFWALLIALLNYIPYIGSIFGVLLPVLLSVVQFVSWPWSLALFVLLITAQTIMGNMVEPLLVGRKVNQSAFVVLVALAFWSSLWGVSGAILAVPMTSILGIIFGEVPALRPLAVFMAEDVEADKTWIKRRFKVR